MEEKTEIFVKSKSSAGTEQRKLLSQQLLSQKSKK
jgi:hypothetical protein